MDIKPELTRREAAIFELFKQGLSDKQIGILAGVGAGTVSHHMNNIRKKYKVRTRMELMIASRKEWVGLTDEEVGTLTVADGLHDIEVPILADLIRTVEAKLKERNNAD